jgi:DNA-directed RNA polymerase subunit M/transcription elongation factor TFIIS
MNRQKVIDIGNGFEVFRYGTIDVLDMDSEIVHQEASNSHYVSNLRKVAWMLQCGNLNHIIDKMTPENWFCEDINDDKICLDTEHAKWEKKFFAQQELARTILSGKLDGDTAPTSGIFQCSKCNSYDIHTDQKQTRSSDEPMTIFCTCNSCGKRFIR